MIHAMEVVDHIYIAAMSALVGVTVFARMAVFCYWWVVDAWRKEAKK